LEVKMHRHPHGDDGDDRFGDDDDDDDDDHHLVGGHHAGRLPEAPISLYAEPEVSPRWGRRREERADEDEAKSDGSYADGAEGVVRASTTFKNPHYANSRPHRQMWSTSASSTRSAARTSTGSSAAPTAAFGSVRNAAAAKKKPGGRSRKIGLNVEWNAMFQAILAMPKETEQQQLERFEKLSALAADFQHTAKMCGKIIISEKNLPDKERTIKEASVGGQAGGTKYIYHGILFKFATNSNCSNIYSADEYAMKAAGHELKGAMRYYLCM